MINEAQFSKAREFIFRHGRLLARQRFLYHFEDGAGKSVLAALSAYQNEDGGFGNGLELDILCPQSSGICTEAGLGYLLELGVCDGPAVERADRWVLARQDEGGVIPHPVEHVRRYPHGPWWAKDDDDRVFALAGLLGQMGRGSEEFYRRTASRFRTKYAETDAFPDDLAVYDYPLNLYLRYAPGAEQFSRFLARLRKALPGMLEREQWHCPLFFCHGRWSEDVDAETWRQQAEAAVATLQADGGVRIQKYDDLPWWRPVWTLDLLVTLKAKGLLNSRD